jgi:hypothetical protein
LQEQISTTASSINAVAVSKLLNLTKTLMTDRTTANP